MERLTMRQANTDLLIKRGMRGMRLFYRLYHAPTKGVVVFMIYGAYPSRNN